MYYSIIQRSTGKVLASGKFRTYSKRMSTYTRIYDSQERAQTRAWNISQKTGIPLGDMILQPRFF